MKDAGRTAPEASLQTGADICGYRSARPPPPHHISTLPLPEDLRNLAIFAVFCFHAEPRLDATAIMPGALRYPVVSRRVYFGERSDHPRTPICFDGGQDRILTHRRTVAELIIFASTVPKARTCIPKQTGFSAHLVCASVIELRWFCGKGN
jgi:hypothetical protein